MCGHLSHERHDCPLGFDDDQPPAASDDDNDDDGDDTDCDDDDGSDPHEMLVLLTLKAIWVRLLVMIILRNKLRKV